MLLLLLAASLAGRQSLTPPPTWDELKALYPKPAPTFSPSVEYAPLDQNTPYVIENIKLKKPDGSTIYTVFIHPKGPGPFPVLIAQHGLFGNKNDFALRIGQAAAPWGFAVLGIDAPLHGEARTPDGDKKLLAIAMQSQMSKVKGDLAAAVVDQDTTGQATTLFSDVVHDAVQNCRISLDYLATRPEVDMNHIGFGGASMGAIIGSIYAPLDPRIKATLLLVGGDPFLPLVSKMKAYNRDTVLKVAPSLYIAHLGGRQLFMIDGTKDSVIPPDSAKRLYDAAAQPKRMFWVESDHSLPTPALMKGLLWLMAETDK